MLQHTLRPTCPQRGEVLDALRAAAESDPQRHERLPGAVFAMLCCAGMPLYFAHSLGWISGSFFAVALCT